MNTNTLVTHMKYPELGIGCVYKKLKASVKIAFAEGQTIDCKPTTLREVVVENAPDTISFEDFVSETYQRNPPVKTLILTHEVHEFTSEGWMMTNYVTMDDLKKYPRII